MGAHTRERTAGAEDAPTVDGVGGRVAYNDKGVAGADAHAVPAADSQRLETGASGSEGGSSSDKSGRSSGVGSEGISTVESIHEVDSAVGNGTSSDISLEQYVACGKHSNRVGELVM
jgi:hypothetical protein